MVRHQTSCISQVLNLALHPNHMAVGSIPSIGPLVAFFSAAHDQGLKCIKFTLDVFIYKISTIRRNSNNKKNFIQLSMLTHQDFYMKVYEQVIMLQL